MDNEGASHTINWLLNISYAVALAAVGMVMSLIFTQMDHLQVKVDAVPEKYVAKQDYRADRVELVTALQKLDDTIRSQGKDIEADYNRRMDKIEKILTNTQEKD